MHITCVNNGGFEDQLTVSQQYHVKEYGENSYLIENDNGGRQWYGTIHFTRPFITE
jgi:hypothetical protein